MPELKLRILQAKEGTAPNAPLRGPTGNRNSVVLAAISFGKGVDFDLQNVRVTMHN
jgi:hypothetical protein